MASIHEDIFLEEKEKSEGDFKTVLRLWKYIKKYKLLIFLTLIALAAATLIELGLPYVIKFGIDNVINVEYSFTLKDSNPPTFVEDTKGTYVLKK